MRGAGYCVDRSCPEYLCLRLVCTAAAGYRCGTCGKWGRIECERATRTGSGPLISDVRVEFAFDPLAGIYRERVAAREPCLPRAAGVFTLQTPLVERAEVADPLARALLAQFAPMRWLAQGLRLLSDASPAPR